LGKGSGGLERAVQPERMRRLRQARDYFTAPGAEPFGGADGTRTRDLRRDRPAF
jgi:hypothetical protein